jgi:3',5'-cyclic AMP phosphodiesterase CpdA
VTAAPRPTPLARRTGVAALIVGVLAAGALTSPASAAQTAGRAAATLPATVGALRGTATATSTFHLIAVGDIAREGGAQASTAAVIAARDPQALLLLGDTAYSSGTTEEYAAWFAPSYGRFLPISWAVPGNHEYRTANAAGFRTYFGVTGRTWWAKRAGSWLVIGLDSEKVGSSAQRDFVKATLRANQGRPTLVAWHRPRYSSGEHRDQRNVAPLWKLVSRDRDVQLVLWGHDHDYERMAVPVRDRRAKAAFVVGTGGAELRGVKRYAGRTWSKRIVTGRYGVLDLQLGATSFGWRFVRTDGTSVDVGTRKVRRA